MCLCDACGDRVLGLALVRAGGATRRRGGVKKESWFGQKGRRSIDKVKDFGTLIGAASQFTGTLAGKDNYAIYGAMEGDCDLTGALLLGPGARWKGNISAGVVFIAGEVEGNVTAHELFVVVWGV